MAAPISHPLSTASAGAAPSAGAPRHWPLQVAACALAVFVGLLLATYMTVVGARLVGYDVVVTRSSVDGSLPPGSVVVGRWLPPAEVQPGTSVIFESRDGARASGPRLHRIVDLSRTDAGVLARTRANGPGGDGRYVLSEAVITPTFSLQYVGYLLSLLLTPLGWLLGFALPTGALCFLGVRRIWASEGHAASPPRGATPER